MKSVLFSLSLIGCAQQSELDPPVVGEVPQAGSSDSPSSAQMTSTLPELGGGESQPPALPGKPVLHCATAAEYTGIGPLPADGSDLQPLFQVDRITVYAVDDGHSVVVETGHSHRPGGVTSRVTHENVSLSMDESSLWLDWGLASIVGWRSDTGGAVFSGGGWGDFSAPPVDESGAPPPPCGYGASVSCWEPNNVQSEFQYDDATGRCINTEQEEGLNSKPVEYIRETRDGECADLRWASLDEGVPFEISLEGWNLAGSNLTEAWLSTPVDTSGSAAFVSMSHASLEGVDLSTLKVPAGGLTGFIDDHTVLPDMDCTVDQGFIACES